MELSELDKGIINRWQGEVPLVSRPYAAMARDLGVDEDVVINRLQHLLAEGVLTRFGPLYNVEKLGGRFCLAAMAVPPEFFTVVTELVNAHPEVAHNYQREHDLNMWFVIATEDELEIGYVAKAIEQETGLPVYLFPKQHEFFVEMKLTV